MPAFRGSLRPEDSRTIRPLPVEVPAGTGQIAIDLTYGPRTVEDRGVALELVRQLRAAVRSGASPDEVLARFWPLRNLLNIAVFDPHGCFRGRWDRNLPEQRIDTVIAERGSSPGMVDGAIPAGTWQLCLEIHQVLTPVTYTLRVETREEAPLPGIAEPGAPRLRSEQASGIGPGPTETAGAWLKGELHVHSEHSDGRQPVAEVVSALAGAGLEFFALTDHNTTTGLRDLPEDGLLALPGFELTTFWGHATCLGISEFVPWYEGERVRPFGQIATEVRSTGGMVCVAHPFSPPNPLCAGCRWEFPDFDWNDADLLEIWNGDRDEHASLNAAALTLWDRLLNSGQRIWGVAGSDMHDAKHLRSRRYARTLVWAVARSTSGILDALRSGRIVVTSGPTLAMRAVVDDRRYEIGETLRVRQGELITITGAVEDASATAQAQLVAGGRRIPVPLRWGYQLRGERSIWVRAEVLEGSTVAALTNPIFIDVIRDPQ